MQTPIKKQIKEFPNYHIDCEGNVYGTKGILKWLDNGNGYKKVHLWKNNKMTNKYVHRLVAEYFIPNPKNLKYIDHIDRNKSNNHYTNLRWSTARDNTDNIANKPRYTACRKGFKKLTSEQKKNIYDLYQSGMKVMEISRKLGITRQTVSSYKNRKP